jgi:DNA invertase Pin-like site-specific DNA recombinase
MIAFLYGRVSTGEQNEGMQVREMRELAERRNWQVEMFVDAGYSGAKESRPELDRMMGLVRRGKCDVVLVYRFDRFARSTRQLVNALDEFRALGVQFISVHESIDTTTPMGKFAFTVFAGIAEFEREIIRERVRSGVAHARSKGVRLGRPRGDVDVEKIALLRTQNVPWREIGKRLGVSHTQAIRAYQQAVTKSSELEP